MKIKVGTRGSKLALVQAKEAKIELEKLGFDVEIIVIKTKGDIHREAPVKNLDKGVFVSEIEKELLSENIDIAVHSSKDMLLELPEGLEVAAYLEREDPSDCLVTADGRKLQALKSGARVGTSSQRRASQLHESRSDLKVISIRGNLDTRLRKLREGICDALAVAYSGLLRLNLESLAAEVFDPEEFLPSPGQGALALEAKKHGLLATYELRMPNAECRSKMKEISNQQSAIVNRQSEAIDHFPTRAEVEAEKSFLKALGGGCRKPIGAYGRFTNGKICLKGVCYLDGKRFEAEGEGEDPEEVGKCVAKKILKKTKGRSIS